jgi:hypothetical protein
LRQSVEKLHDVRRVGDSRRSERHACATANLISRHRNASDRYIAQLELDLQSAIEAANGEKSASETLPEEPHVVEQPPPDASRCSEAAAAVRVVHVRVGGQVWSGDAEALPTSLDGSIDLIAVNPQQTAQLQGAPISPMHSWHQQQISMQRDSLQRRTLDQMRNGATKEEVYLAM